MADHEKSEFSTAPFPKHIIFGKPPADPNPPEPPLPPPPGTYATKPKYWQLRGTQHGKNYHYIALFGTAVISGVAFLFYKFGHGPERFYKFFGMPLDPQERQKMYAQEWENRKFSVKVMSNWLDIDFDTVHGKIRKRKEWKPLRWDMREVDRTMQNCKHLHRVD